MRCIAHPFACSVVLLLFGGVVRAEGKSYEVVKTGGDMPKFSVQGTDGQTLTAESLKGKVVLLNFFATWCGPCVREMPVLQKLHESYKDKSFVLISIGRKHSVEEVKKFAEEKKLTFLFAADPNAEAFNLFATGLIPRTYVIDRDGKIVFKTVGFNDTHEAKLTKAIDQTLAAKAPAP